MHKKAILACAVLASVLAVPVAAQQPAASAGTKAVATSVPAQAALAALAAARGAELAAEGIQSINARTGKKRRDLQVSTRWGPVYFPWPKNVEPVTFELEVGKANAVVVRANGYSEADKAAYAAAFDAVIPAALKQARIARSNAERPRP